MPDSQLRPIEYLSTHPMRVNVNTRVRWQGMKAFPELQDLAGKSVLDIGAGLGYFSLAFAERGADVTAVDVDAASLDYLKKKGLRTQQVDIRSESLPNDLYDIIFAGEVLEHISDPKRFMNQVATRLKPGGIAILTTPAMEGALIHSKGKALCHDHGAEKHERDGYFLTELQEYVELEGLQIVRHQFTVFNLAELFMQLTKRRYLKHSAHYESQTDVLALTRSRAYKALSAVYPFSMGCFGLKSKSVEKSALVVMATFWW